MLTHPSPSTGAPLPPFARLLAAVMLAVLLGLFLSSPTLAQQRKASKKTTTSSSSGGSGGAYGGNGYKTGLGLRAGSPAGVTIKHFFRGPVAVEGIVGTNFNRRGFNVTLLLEKHGTAFQSRGLLWYYGLGGHVSSYKGHDYYAWYYDRKGRLRYTADYYDNRHYWGLGIDGVLGLEYQFKDLPFTLGVDAKPTAELVASDAFFWVEGAVSLRYVF